MAIDEKTRLDLRNGFEELLGSQLADAVMEAMPPLDYAQLATKRDVAHLGIELRGEMAELRGEVAELRGEVVVMGSGLRGDMAKMEGSLGGEMASILKTMVITQLATALAVAGFVAGLS